MSNMMINASEFLSHYGTSSDSRASNDCYRIFSRNGEPCLDLFMHSTIGIKSAFSISNLSRNEDLKIHEAETLDAHHSYDVFSRFGLDLDICNHLIHVVIRKPALKNYDTKFNMHSQIFDPTENFLSEFQSKMDEEPFYELSNIKKEDIYPTSKILEIAKEKNFFPANTNGFGLDYGFPVMGKTTSYWTDSSSDSVLISVKQKSLVNSTRPTNRVLSLSILKAIQLASEIVPSSNTVLALSQNLKHDLKTQYRISFPGEFDESSISRTYMLHQGETKQYIYFNSKTVVDRSNERTTLIIKIVTKNTPSDFRFFTLPAKHENCRRIVGASFGMIQKNSTDPNYNMIIAQELLSVHTMLALKISDALKKPVIVYKLYDRELKNEVIKIGDRVYNYNSDGNGDIYFLSATLSILPKTISVMKYLSSVAPSCWDESESFGHFSVMN
ncbi:non-structural protein [Scadoxus chlorotic ringspot virus]|nr:non-structural protein [Scadoxus chlorotic ringspot virus]